MLRLSRRAWNNVLIFSMLIMIMLLNGMHKKFDSADPLAKVPLLPEHSLVLTLDFGKFAIERIGQSWRIKQSDAGEASKKLAAVDGAVLTAFMATWSEHIVTLAESDEQAAVLVKGKMPDHYVVATLAGKSDGAVYAFYAQLDDVIIHDQYNGRFVTMPIDDVALLFPEQLFPEQLFPTDLSSN